MQFDFIKYSKIYYVISGILIIAAIASLVVFGLKFGIEFTGGSVISLEFKEKRPSHEEVSKALEPLNLGSIIIQPTGEKGMVLRLKEVNEENHQKILEEVNKVSETEEKSFQYIGPSVGNELRNKTQIAIVLALLAITLYIAFAFRKVSRPVASWKYGITSLIALFHDIIIPLGLFAVLGKYSNAEITIPIVAALLTILGFSVHDTIVIFDRIRENILRSNKESFADTINVSLNQTFGRSISTVATVLLVMLSVFFFGGETLKWFSLALIIGVGAGAYSSVFIAAPLLVTWENFSKNRGKKR